MVGKFKIDLDEWIDTTWQKQQVDISYISTYHIDELLINNIKEQWINDSLDILNALECRLKEKNKKDITVLLVFTLNRSRQKGHVISQIDDFCFNKTEVPPEFYLVRRKYNDFFSYIKEKSQKITIHNELFSIKKIYYMKKWNHGFDRYLWVYK